MLDELKGQGEKGTVWGLIEGDSCFQKLTTHNTAI